MLRLSRHGTPLQLTPFPAWGFTSDTCMRPCLQRMATATVAQQAIDRPHYRGGSPRRRFARERLGESVAQAALDVGFADQAHFTKRFKQLTVTTPALYARTMQ